MSLEFLDNFMHDQLVRASASTYSPTDLQRFGLQITSNTSTQKVRYLGTATNPIYPDIVIWRPDYPNANTGQAVIVELLENQTFTHGGVPAWIRLSSATGIRFNLIVPLEQVSNAKKIISTNKITNINLQAWLFDKNTNKYQFKIET